MTAMFVIMFLLGSEIASCHRRGGAATGRNENPFETSVQNQPGICSFF
jgi:hypothetical protein